MKHEKEGYLVLGYANYDCKDRDNYEMSLEHFGYKYKVVGQGEKWHNFIDNKIKKPLEYLKTVKQKYKIIIFTDVFDVMACQGPETLIEKFKETGKRICIGMENVCFSVCCIPLTVDSLKNQTMKYVNSGFYIGYTQDIIDMWQSILEYGDKDDQRCIAKYINQHPEKFHFDCNSDFVGNIHIFSSKYFKWQNGIVRSDFANDAGRPCFLHFPGSNNLGWYVDHYGPKLFGDKYLLRTSADKLKAWNKFLTKFEIWTILGAVVLIVLIIIMIYCYYW